MLMSREDRVDRGEQRQLGLRAEPEMLAHPSLQFAACLRLSLGVEEIV